MATTVKYRTLDLAGAGTPVIELTGDQDGPRLTVLAGRARLRVRADGRGPAVDPGAGGPGGLRGRVTAVPVLNLTSFRSRTPFVTPDDGKNLNRCFPATRTARSASAWPTRCSAS